ncbi:MAG: hypothetical protein HQK49_18100 [Oligoflexia bacterium]|nr:hypothetical protein [Oligoflexia bacterium]
MKNKPLTKSLEDNTYSIKPFNNSTYLPSLELGKIGNAKLKIDAKSNLKDYVSLGIKVGALSGLQILTGQESVTKIITSGSSNSNIFKNRSFIENSSIVGGAILGGGYGLYSGVWQKAKMFFCKSKVIPKLEFGNIGLAKLGVNAKNNITDYVKLGAIAGVASAVNSTSGEVEVLKLINGESKENSEGKSGALDSCNFHETKAAIAGAALGGFLGLSVGIIQKMQYYQNVNRLCK